MELTHHLPELEKLAQGLPKGTGPRVDDAVPAGGTGRVDGVADTQLEDALLKERPAERPEGAPSPAPAPTQRSAYEALLQENMSLMLHHSVAPRYRARWYQQVIRSWRTYGIGFMVHCDFSSEYLVTDGRLNAAGVAVARNNAPVLVYIADGPDEFVRKDHAAFAGESIVKQIVICNDRFQPMRVKSEWQMTDRGQPESVLASGMDEVDVPPGEIRFRRIETQAPPAPARRPLLLRLAATVNGERQIRPPKAIHPYQRETTNLLPPELSYGDEFAIEVFPKPGTPRIAGPVHLLDTTGDTRTMLAKTGTTVSDLAPDAPVPGKGLVLIGRNSLSGPVLDWFVRPETASALAAGLNVVVFEQRSRWLTGLRMKHLDERQVFIADPSHPLVTGLRDEDFAHWRGASDIIPAYPVPPAIAAYRGSPAPPVPPPPDEPDEQDTLLARAPDTSDDLGDEHVAAHWSNHNMVATYSFIKPQCPGFRCILQDGFDLLYSPLVERRIGQGRILYCALDVTNRYGFDPMATILVHRILEEYSRSVPRAERRLVSLGPGRGQAFLEKAGRVAEALRDPDGLGAADLLVLHGDDREDFQRLSKAAPQIRQAIQSGASVLLVRVGKDSPLDFLPFDMRREEAEVYETEFPREWSLLSGLSASDFFWRRTVPIVRVSTPAPGARNLPSGLIAQIPCGKGQVVFFQADDEMFRKPYDLVEPDRKSSQILRRWVRVKVYRILNSLLDEMGAAAPRPARLDGNTYESRVGAYVERGEPFHPMAHRGW
jgi:beta-galactosidase